MTRSDLLTLPPIPCDFAVGDLVIYRNDYGAEFLMIVIGFSDDPVSFGEHGRFIHTDFHLESGHKGAAWWMPKAPESLQLDVSTAETH